MKTPVIALFSTLVLYPGRTTGAPPATLNLPLAFEANHGQSDPAVKFLAQVPLRSFRMPIIVP